MTITEPTPKSDNIISSELAGTAIDSLTDLIEDEESDEYEEVYEDLDEEVGILREFNEDMQAYTDALDNYNTQFKRVDWDSMNEDSLATVIDKMELKVESAPDDAMREKLGRDLTTLRLSQDRLDVDTDMDSLYSATRNNYMILKFGLPLAASNEARMAAETDIDVARDEFHQATAQINIDARACELLALWYPAH